MGKNISRPGFVLNMILLKGFDLLSPENKKGMGGGCWSSYARVCLTKMNLGIFYDLLACLVTTDD